MRRLAVILAGGRGERFWPLSTPEQPKPFLRLFGPKSLLETTGERLRGIFGEASVFVAAPPQLAPLVREHLPWLPEDNLLLEPEPKDTAFAVALALKRLPEGVLAFFPADHHVGDEQAFARDLEQALCAAAELPGLFTIGVPAAYPATGYGYLEKGAEVRPGVYRVARFREKPNPELAEEFVASGRYYWNAGIYLAQRRVWLEEFQQHAPWVLEGRGEKISLDYAVSEKSQRAYMVLATFPWDDLGDWTALERHFPKEGPNLALGRHLGLHTEGAIIYAPEDELVVTIGLQDTVVVRHGKVTLLVRKDLVAELKKVARLLNST
ncbi:mannose-1-phosphate guanylyltransferase [Meiothermus sp. QL-1]|uniref:mannose-1-phosphate guanylyltransferase n=1 Tax=Meiothermus sp. QL-1 TaxID=2058095 RepID=UPI000E0C37F3|nr:mannose-1-phosphate guanylyltransferase [Meiothermus sp. QL-1]RDI95759.1 mannose-1-phosphate guanylyltransferase [Meiothermus sp. QL-1]